MICGNTFCLFFLLNVLSMEIITFFQYPRCNLSFLLYILTKSWHSVLYYKLIFFVQEGWLSV